MNVTTKHQISLPIFLQPRLPSLVVSGQSSNILCRIENARKRKFSELEEKKEEKKPVFSSERAIKRVRSTFDFIAAKNKYLNRLEQICNVASPRMLHISLSCLKRVVIPAFSEKNLIIRRPLPSEIDWVSDYLHYDPDESLWYLFKNGGFSETKNDSFRMLVIQSEDGKATHGAIHYSFSKEEEPTCELISLQILPEFQRKGQGFLLLACMIMEAREKGCHKISLLNSIESAPFYEKYGFYPECYKENWFSLSREEKLAILSHPEFVELIILDPHSAEIQKQIHQHLKHFFSAK